MGVCACTRTANVYDTLNSFWASLPIRLKEIKDVVELTKAKKGSIKPIQEKKWLLFQDSLLVIDDFKENCLKMFNKALELSREQQNEGYLFMSLLFLAKSKDTLDFKINFIKLGETVGGIKDSLRTQDEDKVTKIKLETLKNIVLFYVNMITLLPCEHLETYVDGNKEFEQITTEMFTIEKQKKYVDEKIMKKYDNNNADSWVEFDKFFDEFYPLLKDDAGIRGHFIYAEQKKK